MFPGLLVFDLDECLWAPETYTLSRTPAAKDCIQGPLGEYGEGVVAVNCGDRSSPLRLFPGALAALQRIHAGEFGDMKIAAASSADTPQAARIAHAAIKLLEVVPGVTVGEVFATAGGGFPDERNLQIGRAPPLSSSKAASHFPILHSNTGIPYSRMLFFDDCNWGDHCARVMAACPGVVAVRTPNGLRMEEFEQGLALYAQTYGNK